jgi:hypothetical protein
LEEFVKAFKSLWVVLVNNVSRRVLAELLRWQLSVLGRCGLRDVAVGIC